MRHFFVKTLKKTALVLESPMDYRLSRCFGMGVKKARTAKLEGHCPMTVSTKTFFFCRKKTCCWKRKKR